MIHKNKTAVLVLVGAVVALGLGFLVFSSTNTTVAFDGPPSSGGVGSGAFAVDTNGNTAIGTTTFSSSKLRVAGSIQSTTGGFVFPDGTTQITASGGVTSTPAGYVTPGTFNSVAGTGGNYTFPASIVLGTTTDSTSGIIYKNAIPFIHTFVPNGTNGHNTFVGEYSGNTDLMLGDGFTFNASNNTGVGYRSLSLSSTGHDNAANGAYSLYSNSSGYNNAANGAYSLYSNISGSFNAATGYKSLYSNTLGIDNTAAGYNSLYSNTTGDYNIGVGEHALYSNTTGDYNTAVGPETLYSNVSGSSNAALGLLALHGNTTGSNNTAVGPRSGYNSGVSLQTMTSSTFVGSGANSSANAITNSTAIGASAQVTKSNQVVVGNGAVTETLLNGNIGIGAAAPSSQLQVSGAAGLAGPVRGGGTLYLYSTDWGTNSGGAVVFGSMIADTMFAGIKGLIQDAGGNTIGDLGFYTRNATGDSTLSERMRIKSTGNVGIGTADPKKLLHLESSSTTLYMTNTTASKGATIIIEDTDGAGCTGVTTLNGTVNVAIVACP